MGHDVLPHRLMPLSVSLLAVAVNYELPRPARLALKRASGVLAGLAQDRNARPVDPDEQMPLLAGADAPSAEDREDREAAIVVLGGHLRTVFLAGELRRLDSWWPEFAAIDGWRWLRAARVVVGPRHDAGPMSFSYLAGIARNFREADRDRPLAARDAAPLSAKDLEGLF